MNKFADASKATRPGSPLPGLDWLNSATMDAMIRANETSNQACQEWQHELIRFITNRIQVDSRHFQQLVTCQNWADAVRLHQDWAMSATQEFTKEANTLFQIASKIGAGLTATAGRPGAAAAE